MRRYLIRILNGNFIFPNEEKTMFKLMRYCIYGIVIGVVCSAPLFGRSFVEKKTKISILRSAIGGQLERLSHILNDDLLAAEGNAFVYEKF